MNLSAEIENLKDAEFLDSELAALKNRMNHDSQLTER